MKQSARIALFASTALAVSLAWAGTPRAQAPAPPQPSQTTDATQVQAQAATANLSQGTETGIATFLQHCMMCHGNPNVPQAPSPDAIRQMPPERIYAALTTGVMKPQGDSLTDSQKKMLATFLSGRPLGSAQEGDAASMPNHCAANPPLADPSAGPEWNGWGNGPANTRFQSAAAAGLSASDVPNLKVKWAFGYPDGLSAFGPATVVSGRVFVGTDIGYIYSLSADTGCVYWSFQTKGSVRTAVTVARLAKHGHGAAKYAAYFGDAHGNAYAIDAHTGALLWSTRITHNFIERITAAPSVYANRVYVPLSNSEEFSASSLDYSCCTSRGAIVALDASTGKEIWETYTVPPPQPSRKNSKGVQQYISSGGSVWNAPTIDPKRRALYFGTGDGQSDPVPDTTDSVMAISMDTGAILWHYQVTANDSFVGGCNGPTRTDNCPKVNGPDQDIGNSPILKTLPDGASVLIFGTKNGRVFALDPDHKGAKVWETAVVEIPKGQENSFAALLNGIVWGGAADDENVYYGLQSGGIVALKLATGEILWHTRFPSTAPRPPSNSAAATMMPGVVFVAGSDGSLHAVSATDGHVLWHYDTAHPYDTVNKVSAHGGAINSIGPAIAGGMLFIGSGYAVVGSNSGNVLIAFSAK
ncbi:MAG TPA: PQQ-binding-like beta-propeller repeat protein [Candidatus Acidoferrales bacterium]|jgi:polyvinyl alcohol dehydrogenase (cytochrome)|nr:PQQ-binding-like beta-propeller repeat protein [Candidatus Acidoferrales bacterium]